MKAAAGILRGLNGRMPPRHETERDNGKADNNFGQTGEHR